MSNEIPVDETSTSSDSPFKAGTVALVGRPNAGKSTLMNQLLPEKVAIVSPKPQTTRHRLVGILSEARGQIVFYDTPGVHRPQHSMNRRMIKAAQEALNEADVIALLVDASEPAGAGDLYMREWISKVETRKIVLLNKIDLISKANLLPRIASYAEGGVFDEIIPISALKSDGSDRVLDVLWDMLPEGEPAYDPDLVTIHPERFLVAERIREKVLERTREELPFSTAVMIDAYEELPRLTRIFASIIVEREGQKRILIGKGGQQVKSIGIAARQDLEAYLDTKVYLDLNVKVEKAWRDNKRILSDLDRAPFDVSMSLDEAMPLDDD